MAATSPSSDRYYPPPESRGGWRRATAPGEVRALGLDPDALDELLEYNVNVPETRWEPYHHYKSCLVIKDGWLVGERYNRPDARTFKQYLASNGKAFSIGLFGHLAEEAAAGRLAHTVDLDSPLYDGRWLPEGCPLSDAAKEAITFLHVFAHSTGILPEDREQQRNNPDVRDFVAYTVGHDERYDEARPLYYPPGHPEAYDGDPYSSVAFNHLAIVIPRLTGQPAHRTLEERILRPIGIEEADYHTSPAWNPPGPGNRWATCGSLRLAPRDYARYAYLLLNGGQWEGRAIIPRGYLDRFRTTDTARNMISNVHGVHGAQYPGDLFRISGSGLSMAFMVPSLDLVFVRTSRAPNELRDEVMSRSLEMLFGALR